MMLNDLPAHSENALIELHFKYSADVVSLMSTLTHGKSALSMLPIPGQCDETPAESRSTFAFLCLDVWLALPRLQPQGRRLRLSKSSFVRPDGQKRER